MVNLSAQTDTVSVKKNQPIAHHELRNEAETSTSHPDIFKAPKNNQIEQERSKSKTSTIKVESEKGRGEMTKKQQEVSERVSFKSQNNTEFKSLDPYAKLPLKLSTDGVKEELFSFDYSSAKGASNMAEYNRITVPKAHVNNEKSEVLATSDGGSKRIERWRGKCYYVNLTTVFGKSGMPQGAPRLCPGEKSDDQILLEKSMTKWERVSRMK